MRKVKTISLQGKNYVQVAERLRAIHEDHKGKFDIVTSYSVTENGNVVFTGTVTIRDVGTFSGHSFGKLGGTKAFEKLETVAVGRALAFAGYHGDGDIASVEEMEDVNKDAEIDYEAIENALLSIADTTTIEELKSLYAKMPRGVKGNKQVIEAKDAQKKKLSV